MFYLVPPAGAPIGIGCIANTALKQLHRGPSSRNFADYLKSSTGARDCLFFNSGRVALFYILETLKDLSSTGKNEIVMPAYTCFSVASAIARSGLQIRLIDLDPQTMDYDYNRLESSDLSNVLAIVSCNLFGMISDWGRLEPVARRNGAYLIEDAAQTLGINSDGKTSGSFGDIAFFSFGRGKNLSTYSGGAAVTTDNEIGERLRSKQNSIDKSGLASEANSIINIILYALFLRPWLYWFPDSLPFLNLGETIFDIDFRIGGMSEFQKSAGAILYPKLDEYNRLRKDNSRRIGEALLRNSDYLIPGFSSSNCPSYLRLPVIVADMEKRDKLILKLREKGIVATKMYPSSINRIPGIEQYLASSDNYFPGAEMTVQQLLCLPTHPYLRESDIDRIISCLTKD